MPLEFLLSHIVKGVVHKHKIVHGSNIDGLLISKSPGQKAQRRRATPLTRFAAGREMPVFTGKFPLFSP